MERTFQIASTFGQRPSQVIIGSGDEPLNDYVAFCFDEACLIAGRAHERRMQEEAAKQAAEESGQETPMAPNRPADGLAGSGSGPRSGGGYSLTPHSDSRAKTSLENMYPNQVVMSTSGELTSGVIPYIGPRD